MLVAVHGQGAKCWDHSLLLLDFIAQRANLSLNPLGNLLEMQLLVASYKMSQ